MNVSTKGRYALRLMLDLAQHSNGKTVSLRDISQRQEISVKYLEQIVGILCKAGLLKSIRGAHGGYRLTKDLSQYTIGSILRATEGSLAPVACLEEEPNRCPRSGNCQTLSFWNGLAQVIDKYVDSVSLEDLVESNQNCIEYTI